jgi:hypothetical protein
MGLASRCFVCSDVKNITRKKSTPKPASRLAGLGNV